MSGSLSVQALVHMEECIAAAEASLAQMRAQAVELREVVDQEHGVTRSA